ncbi:MAG: hypothetical protein COA62_07035 [Rhodobiaceae bacterium]|nr:MAG: hypothetical protein COA62_07035 [Rhodobiaceae bacterium]
MRWLFLINLVAVVLLSGAVAIVLEGTPLPMSRSALAPSEPGADVGPDASNQPPEEMLPEEVAVVQNDGVGVPLPLQAPRLTTNVDQPEAEIIAPPRILRIATEGDFAPFNFQNDKGEPAGFDIDIAVELCARLTRECIIEIRTWSSLQSALINQEVDILVSSIQIPSVAPGGILFSDPYYGSHGRFVGPADTALLAGENFPLSGTQIAVQRDTVHSAYLASAYPNIERVYTQTFGEALAMVEAGKVESAFGDNAAALRWLKARACCAVVGEPVSDRVFFGQGIGIAVRAGDGALLAGINQALEQMVADGTHARLSQHYFVDSIY